MIIQCKNCNTKFRVDEYQIGKNSRMVCCSICEYEWLIIQDQYEILEEEISNIPENQIRKHKLSKSIFLILNSFMLLLFLFLFFERKILVKQHKFLQKFHQIFNYHNLNEIKRKVYTPIKRSCDDDKETKKGFRYKIPLTITNRSNTQDSRYIIINI